MRGLAVDLQSPGSSGTASLGIALNVPKARALTPALNVSYDSGGGNGPYGAGVSIAIASISRPPRRACRRIPGRTCWYSAKPACWWKRGIGTRAAGPRCPHRNRAVRKILAGAGLYSATRCRPAPDRAMDSAGRSGFALARGQRRQHRIALWRQRLGGSTIRRILAGYSNGCWKRWPTPRATAPNTATRPTTTPRQAVPTDISRKSATATIFPLRKPTRPTPTNWCSTMASTRWTDCRAPAPIPMRRRAPGPSGPTRFPASAAVSRSAPGACAVACSLS